MLEMIAAIIVSGSLCLHVASLLSLRKELKDIKALISPENASYVEKNQLKRFSRRAARLTDGSKKWLENRGKKGKEVN